MSRRILSTRDEPGRHRRGSEAQVAELRSVLHANTADERDAVARIVGVFKLSDEDAETLLSMLGLDVNEAAA